MKIIFLCLSSVLSANPQDPSRSKEIQRHNHYQELIKILDQNCTGKNIALSSIPILISKAEQLTTEYISNSMQLGINIDDYDEFLSTDNAMRCLAHIIYRMLFIYRADIANQTSYARQLIKQLAQGTDIPPAMLEVSLHDEMFTQPVFTLAPYTSQYSMELPIAVRNIIDRINLNTQCNTTDHLHILLEELITHTAFYRDNDILIKFHTESESIAYIVNWLYFLKSLPEALELPPQPYKCAINCVTNTLSFHCNATRLKSVNTN